jgi:hypothetical protein
VLDGVSETNKTNYLLRDRLGPVDTPSTATTARSCYDA